MSIQGGQGTGGVNPITGDNGETLFVAPTHMQHIQGPPGRLQPPSRTQPPMEQLDPGYDWSKDPVIDNPKIDKGQLGPNTPTIRLPNMGGSPKITPNNPMAPGGGIDE